ncbi:MAG: hypothetical protein IJV40_02940 [Oscillospiraceae bacterium]|nr:hypothetical protein [Oscillospiraceae bacterium]
MKNKKIFISVLVFALITALFLPSTGYAAGRKLKILNDTASRDNVTVTLKKASAQRKTKPDRYEYALSGTIENNSDEGIMRVVYTFSFFDKDGEEFRSFAEVYDGLTQAIPPHSKIEFSHDGIKWGAQSVPASVSIGIGSIKTESQLPPVKIPQPGEALYLALGDEKLAGIRENPPVELSFHIDQGGYGRTATFGEGPLLDEAVELFCGIKIGEETGEWVTDNYNWIRLTWEDGTASFISINLYNLEHYLHSESHIFTLENLSDFWSFAAAYLKEDR